MEPDTENPDDHIETFTEFLEKYLALSRSRSQDRRRLPEEPGFAVAPGRPCFGVYQA